MTAIGLYGLFVEFTRPDYNSNDTGFIQAVYISSILWVVAWFFIAFFIPKKAQKLQGSGHLSLLQLIKATIVLPLEVSLIPTAVYFIIVAPSGNILSLDPIGIFMPAILTWLSVVVIVSVWWIIGLLIS